MLPRRLLPVVALAHVALRARAVHFSVDPRLAARAKAVSTVEAIAAVGAPPDPPRVVAANVDWAALPEPLHPAAGERGDEVRRSRCSLEALAAVAAGLRVGRVVDPCAGKGDCGLAVAAILGAPALLADVDSGALEKAARRAEAAGLDGVSTQHADAAALAASLEPGDVVVALRACGAVADMVIRAAAEARCAFAVSPCCLWKATRPRGASAGRMPGLPAARPDDLVYPRSAWLAEEHGVDAETYEHLVNADDPPAARASAALGGGRTPLFKRARRILEEDRLRYAAERGFSTRLLRFDGGDNPFTGILAGAPSNSPAADGLARLDVEEADWELGLFDDV